MALWGLAVLTVGAVAAAGTWAFTIGVGAQAASLQLVAQTRAAAKRVLPRVAKGSAVKRNDRLRPAAPFKGPVLYKNEVVVLMYHAIDTRRIPGDVITPETFAQELKLLRKDHYNIITMEQLRLFLAKRGGVPPNAVLITFDNGYESFYRTAFPLLLKYRDPSVLLPIVSWLQHPGHRGIFHTLTWTQVERMHQTGLVSVQSQSYNLHRGIAIGPHTTTPATVGREYNPATGMRETPAQYDKRVLSDLERAKRLVEQHLHTTTVNAFSYPFGDYRPALIHLLHVAGYRYLFTAKQGWAVLPTTNPDHVFRINAGSPSVSANGLMSTIAWIAKLTAAAPTWAPPRRFVQTWTVK